MNTTERILSHGITPRAWVHADLNPVGTDWRLRVWNNHPISPHLWGVCLTHNPGGPVPNLNPDWVGEIFLKLRVATIQLQAGERAGTWTGGCPALD